MEPIHHLCPSQQHQTVGTDPATDAGGITMTKLNTRWAALLAAGGLVLAGCGAGGASDSSGGDVHPEQSQATRSEQSESGAGSAREGGGDDSSAGADQSASTKDSSGKSSTYKAPTDAHIARTASLSITVEDIEQGAAKVRSEARSAGGYVSQEDSRAATSEGGRSWAEITVTVPVDELDRTTNDLAEIGEVTKRASSAEDLTSQYTDTAARVKTKTKAVERLRTLIDSTDDLDQVVTLEDELATREADLESMVSQQKSLEKRTATAPITVSLTTEATEADETEEDTTGFIAGLSGGWDAFTGALTVGLTVLGAITPFAVTAVFLLAPVAWWARRRRRVSAS